MSLFLLPSLTIALCGCFIMGLSGGVTTPAGSEVLQRFSPPEKRNLIFSIKQAGVPLGGVMAGLAIPAVVAFAGWRAALYATAGMVMLVTLLTWRLTAGFDRVVPGQGGWAWPTLASLRMLAVPLRSLRHSAGLMKISVVGSLFAVSQSCWFTFTVVYLVDRLDFSLGKAGLIFSIMQAGGVAGRITLGWVADHFNSTTAALAIAALVSSGTTIILGLITQDWSFGAIVVLALVAGCSAASWNGVQMAEVARRSPADMVAETAAGAGMLVNLANMITPTLFAAYVAATGRYDLAFAFAGACSLLVVVFLPRDEARR